MIKNQRLIQIFFKDLSRSSLPFQRIIKFPVNPSQQINFKSFINFSSQANPNAEVDVNQIKTEVEKDQLDVEDWGSRKLVPKKPQNYGDYLTALTGYTFQRVLDTCKIYGKSTPEERALITKESRFYYVKERLDKLSVEDQKEFFNFAEGFGKFVKERAEKKYGEKVPKSVVAVEGLHRNTTVDYILSDLKFEPVITDLILELLNTENPDFKCLTSMTKEEFAVGQFEDKPRDISKLDMKLTTNLDDSRRSIIQVLNRTRKITSFAIPVRDKVNLPKRRRLTKSQRNSSVFNHLRVVFIRLLQTIRIYIESPLEKRENVPKVSRFYYVHQRLGTWNQQELDRLWQYLDLIYVDSTYGLTEEQLGKSNKKRKILGSCNQTELFYILNHEQYGALLKDLLVEFFKSDNLDRYYFLNAQENESAIGKFTVAPQKMSPLTREYYNENIAGIKGKLQVLIDATNVNQLDKKGPRRKSLLN